MDTNNIIDFSSRDTTPDALTQLLRTGAQQLIATAVEAKLESFLVQFATARTAAGHASVVRNGHHPARSVQTGIGPVSVRIPKVRSRVSVRCAPPNVCVFVALVSTMGSGHLGALYGGKAEVTLKSAEMMIMLIHEDIL